MQKIFCDICGAEIKDRYTQINLPSVFGGEVIQSHDEDLADDVCKTCAVLLYKTISDFKVERKAASKDVHNKD